MSSSWKTKESLFLFCILLAAMGVRFLFWRYGYLYGNDPYYHFSNFNDFAKYGHALFPLGLYSPSLLVNFFLQFLGISSYDSFRITTPIFGLLIIFMVYLITKEILNKNAAIFSAIILSFTPVFILRTIPGNYRGDPLSIFFVVLTFFMYLKSIGPEKGMKGKSRLLIVLGGFSMAMAAVVWSSGFIFGALVLTGFLAVAALRSFIFDEENRGIYINYVILFGTSMVLINIFNYLSILDRPISVITGFSDFLKIIFPLTISGVLILGGVKLKIKNWTVKRRIYLLLASLSIAGGILALLFPDFINGIINLYKPGYTQKHGVFQITSELVPLDWESFLKNFNIIWIFSLLGVFYFIKGKNPSDFRIFLTIWLLGSIYIMWVIGQRGTFVASIPMAIFAGFGIYSLVDTLKGLNLSPLFLKFPWLVAFLILAAITIQGFSYSNDLEPKIDGYWYDALTWENENLPEDSVVLSWWDYGHWIYGIGGGEIIVSPGKGNNRVTEVADFFFQDNSGEMVEYLKKNEVDYVIVSSDMIGKMPYMQQLRKSNIPSYIFLTYNRKDLKNGVVLDNFNDALFVSENDRGELSAVIYADKIYQAEIFYKKNSSIKKSNKFNPEKPVFKEGWFYISYGDLYMKKIVIDNVLTEDIDTYAIFIPEEMKNMVITSLLFFDGENTDGLFTLIYSNPEIKIYRANYNITKIAFFKSREMEYRAGEAVELIGDIKSTSPFQGIIKVRVLDPDGNELLKETLQGIEGDYIPPIGFSIPEGSPRGEYSVSAILLDLNGTKIDKYSSGFSVVW